MSPLRVGILVSGRGSNMAAVLSAIEERRLPGVEVAVVVSNNSDAAALDLARARSLPTAVVNHTEFGKDREAFEARLDETLRAHGTELVVLAGFMRLLTPFFVARWRDRLVNIHPSLLPSFPGLHAQRQALAAGVKLAGCTVHFVDEGTDSGPIIAQSAVPVLLGDTEDSLAARILVEEHRLLPKVIGWIAAGRVRVDADTGRADVTDA